MNEDFERAVEALKAGQAVIFPTDTVYGLGVAVNYAPSPQLLYDIKHRPADKPIAWLVGDISDLERYGKDVSDEARGFADEGWPGALTIIVKASDRVPPAYRSVQGTIGLRVPASDIACALMREVGPIAATSANRSGEPVPKSYQDIDPDLLVEVASIEGYGRESGIASTLIDCTKGESRVIRP